MSGRAVQEGTSVETPTGQRHVFLEHVRFADLDPLNHVNNVRMLTYLEDARISLLRWDDADSSSRFGDVVVARHEVDYLRPLQMRRDPFRVETWVTEIRNASFTVRYEILDDDAVYLKALSVLVAYDLAQQRPRRLSPEERAHLARYYLP
ncbi:acyl-CoA thioesterase [Thermobifida fusca]|uniref:acyl-CoA thioesterase n=1 Tax=Thermobifida fusca TaxID=2021 RepID=UPI001878FB24|nr:thioesterase family protein [Thermobifida fusca]QOS58739.1 acyl-CoA thioesterase [Thermobifida fusca]